VKMSFFSCVLCKCPIANSLRKLTNLTNIQFAVCVFLLVLCISLHRFFLLCTVPFNSCLFVAFYYFGTCKYNSSKLIIRKLKKTLIVLSHNNWWFLVLELAISK